MPKPDPALLDPARYPFACEMQTRFGDLDVNLHVNNVAMAGILEDARVRFHKASGYHAAIENMTSMVVSLGIEYLGQAYHPQPLQVHVGAADLGRSSYSLCQLVIQDGRVVAFARATFVCVRDGRPTPLPEKFALTVQPFMLRAD
jgi:acyl-CoA thioester hydrolase